jgi:hypothetical protein
MVPANDATSTTVRSTVIFGGFGKTISIHFLTRRIYKNLPQAK